MKDCIHLGKAFVQKLFDCLNDMFIDFPTFNATQLFSRHSYFEEDDERDSDVYVEILILETHQ